jgi:leucyl aminopeptidase
MTPPRFVAVDAIPADTPVLGVPVFSDLSTPPGAGAQVDRPFLIQRCFEGQPGQAQALLASDGGTVIALGVGKPGSVTADALRQAGAALARQSGNATKIATTLPAAAPLPDLAAAVVEGIGLGAYRYAGAPVRKGDRRPVRQVAVIGASSEAVRRGRTAVEATWRARDWINTPPRDLTPRVLAELAAEAAAAAGVDADVWDEDRIALERLGGLLGVAAGASEPPRLIHLDYHPTDPQATLAFVGKGITFDSGGLSLKTAAGMMTMKDDMGGAAAVICATIAAAELGLPVRVTAWVAATENMPSGTAIHPGDVLTARNGKRIEVLNTDAEGRLVLADALSLAVEQKPDAIVDVATLTGGQRVALGAGVGAVLGNDRDVVRRVIEAGERAGEPAWELPLHAGYRKDLDSQVADLKNITGDTAASAIMAALFLQEFTGRRPWAHLDIAGPAWSDKEDGWISRGGTGWATRTLIELARAWT